VTPEQEASLTQGGDCFSHYHSEDRIPTQDFLHGLQMAARVVQKSANFTASLRDDYTLVTTTSGIITVTLPKANSNRVLVFVRVAGANKFTLVRSGTDTINGAATLDVTTSYSPVRLLALKGVGYVQV